MHFELAELLHTSSDPAVKKEAEEEYHAALKENPQDEKSILRLAEIDAQKGNSEQSYQEYTKAVRIAAFRCRCKAGIGQDVD